ncbi:hypothetical protein FE697_000630 [Mumia zhuanghuii]|uniref:Uncharacterized protein n=2 Tax=Mumia TaxID=1546255 RepID=A0ABW1QS11_9ACTN|nr:MULTISPECIES: hypothetical protein [Mumia]KAA1424475.1 hypothetical protein FE697_000630 [Mumia zhuanghuii]
MPSSHAQVMPPDCPSLANTKPRDAPPSASTTSEPESPGIALISRSRDRIENTPPGPPIL